ncbi:MAG: baseplate J/gp47 family protein [Chloroflexota bacterium]|nr:baseplate J/gp47 family protein [Chloroflexota bacterium]
MSIIYLDAEDEITGAVARLRALTEKQAVLVLPPGSRLGTSRINFRLLAREAEQHGMQLTAVSYEPSVRALAVSAGVPAYDSVATAETALDDLRRQDEPADHAGVRPADARAQRAMTPPAVPAETAALPRADESTRVMPPMPPSAARRPAPADRPPDEASPVGERRVPVLPLLALGLVGLLVGGALYAAYLYLPTATVSLRPQPAAVGPVELQVTADPSVTVADFAAAVIPAERIAIPLRVSGQFPATGVEVTRTHATGAVVFESENTFLEVPIPAGTIVATSEGTEFETTSGVTVPKASIDAGRSRVDVPVAAVRPGQRGNVEAGTITQLPDELTALLISVTNPQPTSGGRREEQPMVTDEDYEAARADLAAMLASELQTRLADPATTPAGLTTYRSTAVVSAAAAAPAADELVGSPGEEFSLSLSATASVLAVNEELVERAAAERLEATIGGEQTLLADSLQADHDAGQVRGTSIVFRASATAQAYTEPDRDALLDAIRGRPVEEARAILEQNGDVEITVWPDVVDRLPDQPARINLRILPPQEGA